MQKITFLTEFEKLHLIDTHITQPNFSDIETVYLCNAASMPVLCPNTAYIGTWNDAKDLLAQVTENDSVLFLLTDAPEDSADSISAFPCNILISDQDVFTLYNIINETLLTWTHWNQKFTISGLQKSSLQALIQLGSEMLHTSIILLNAGYSMICYQLHDDFDESAAFPGLHTLLSKGFLSIQTLLQMKEEAHTVILPVKQGAGTLAYLLFPELNEENYCIRTFASILQQALRQHMATQNRSNEGHHNIEFEQLIYDLINMNTISGEEIQNRLSLMGASLKKYYCCMTVYMNKDDMMQSCNLLISSLEQIFPAGYFSIYEDHIVSMLPVQKRSLPDFDRTALVNLLQSHHAKAGFSGPLMRLEQFRTLYLMSCAALRLGTALSGRQSDPIYVYNDYRIYHMIDMCREGFIGRYHHDNLAYLCHPMVIALYIYDKEHQTEFIEILSTYLQSDSNLTKTAKVLNFHRNTMLYKLSKIESIINSPLDDPNLKQTLLLSCYIIRYISEYLKEDVLKYNPIQK